MVHQNCWIVHVFFKFIFQKEWCLFYFNVNEKSLRSVPSKWVKAYKHTAPDGKISRYDKCWFPPKDSKEATQSTFSMLVSNCSEPDYEAWSQLRGCSLGVFSDLSRCEAALDHYEGTIVTSETENIDNIVNSIVSEIDDQQQQQHRGLQREERVALADLVQNGRRVPANVQGEQAARPSTMPFPAATATWANIKVIPEDK